MSVKKNLIVIGCIILLSGCASTQYYGNNTRIYSDNSPKSRGVRYLLGRGVDQDNEKAFYYFKKAAEENDALAQNELAYLYAAGKGTPRDSVKAFKWYQRAAGHGLSSAQYNLALFYLHGIGTTKNKQQAMTWLNKSAGLGFAPARLKLDQLKQG